jgi:carbon starvation protein
MLAGLALVFCCVVMVKMKREKYLWIPALPTAWLLVCTLTAGWQKLFDADPKIGFLANARRFSDAAARGELLAPAKSIAEMQRVALNNTIDAGLTALFIAVMLAIVVLGTRAALAARRHHAPTARENAYVALESLAR